MYIESINHFAALGATKLNAMKNNPSGFFIGAMMAGVYVGLGIILIFILRSSLLFCHNLYSQFDLSSFRFFSTISSVPISIL